MAFISIAVLGPAGWILSNSTDSNRKKQWGKWPMPLAWDWTCLL